MLTSPPTAAAGDAATGAGAGAADAAVCPPAPAGGPLWSRWRTGEPGSNRKTPRPARARTITAKAATRWADVSCIVGRYFRRRGRSQNGPDGLASSPRPVPSPFAADCPMGGVTGDPGRRLALDPAGPPPRAAAASGPSAPTPGVAAPDNAVRGGGAASLCPAPGAGPGQAGRRWGGDPARAPAPLAAPLPAGPAAGAPPLPTGPAPPARTAARPPRREPPRAQPDSGRGVSSPCRGGRSRGGGVLPVAGVPAGLARARAALPPLDGCGSLSGPPSVGPGSPFTPGPAPPDPVPAAPTAAAPASDPAAPAVATCAARPAACAGFRRAHRATRYAANPGTPTVAASTVLRAAVLPARASARSARSREPITPYPTAENRWTNGLRYMNTDTVTSEIIRILSAHGSTASLAPMMSVYAYSSTLRTSATAPCVSSTPTSSSPQRSAMTRPKPGCVPTMRKNGPAISSSRKPSFKMISVIAISSTSTPASRAANTAAKAICSLVVHCLPWNSGYTAGSFCLIEAAMPAKVSCLAWMTAAVGFSFAAIACDHSSCRA